MGITSVDKAHLLARIRDAGRRRTGLGPFSHYRTRLLTALGLSMLFVYGAFHLPLVREAGTAWKTVDQFDPLYLQTARPEIANGEGGGIATHFETPPGLIHQAASVGPETAAGATKQTPDTGETDSAALPLTTQRIVPKEILQFAEQPPAIRGGMGALYLNIAYPEDALAANIQGRVVLSFVVEPDGSTSNIQVRKALYASCDSAAVRAVRETRFIPGHQAGQPVRVRMHLPIRFQLIVPTDSTATPSATF